MKTIYPGTEEEWRLEQRVFEAADNLDEDNEIRQLIKDLWCQYVKRAQWL